MRDQTAWSVSLGRWGGVQVRLHIFFLLFTVLTLFLSSQAGANGQDPAFDPIALISLLILTASVLWHELWHVHAAHRLGGSVQQSILVPWGGMTTMRPPLDAHSEMIVHLAGPFANAAICLVCLPAVFVIEGLDLVQLLHPIHPHLGDFSSVWTTTLALLFWINWIILLINLIPAFPFDGGRVARCALLHFFSPRLASLIVARFAQFAAVGLVVAGWFLRDANPGGMVPVWFALMMLAIFLFFSATYEPERKEPEEFETDVFGYDFSQGYTSLERTSEPTDDESHSPIAQWLEQRREARRRKEVEQEAEEEVRVDEILAKLHQGGSKSLSEQDREILKRASERYRSRMAE